jgi:integrase
VKEAGLHADGGGLYFSTLRGARRWVLVYQWQGRRREMGLGTFPEVSLGHARDLAAEARKKVAAGINPVESRKEERAIAAAPDITASPLTFSGFAEEYVASVEEGWRNAVHRQQWRNTLRDYAKSISQKPIADIDTDDVLAVLRPIWSAKPETANRVRGRIEKILAAAKARGLRSRESMNPAQWRGHLDVLLPRRSRLTRGHHAAMPYSDIPSFMRALDVRPAMAARALEFTILNASRTGEVLGARWSEIDEDVWTVPAERMKAGVAHSVTLSSGARGVLDFLTRGKPGDFIFHGSAPDRPLSNMAMAMVMRRMEVGGFTVHGFRSAFKDWSIDCTEFPDEISEEALAHVVGSKVRRAYRRGEALDRRRRLMEAWSEFLLDSQDGRDSENNSKRTDRESTQS